MTAGWRSSPSGSTEWWRGASCSRRDGAVLSHWSAAALWGIRPNSRPLDDVESFLREMEFLELRDRLSLWDLIERYPGRRGVRKAAGALERLKDDPPGRRKSPLEERFAPSDKEEIEEGEGTAPGPG